MAYTALQQMKNRNEKAFGKGVGPIQPERHYDSVDHGLKAMALRFLHARCEELGFGADEKDCAFHGTSLLPGWWDKLRYEFAPVHPPHLRYIS